MSRVHGIRSAALIGLACAIQACTTADENTVHGGGTIIPWSSQLVVTEPGTLVAAVIGLSTVEALRVSPNAVDANEIPADSDELTPSHCDARAPMGLAVADVTPSEELKLELIVQDPCGVWFAEHDTSVDFHPARSERLEAVGPVLHMEAFQGGAMLALANDPELTIMELPQGHVSTVPLPGASLAHRVTKLFVPLAETFGKRSSVLLAQRHAALQLVSIANESDGEVALGPLLMQEIAPPYLRPFDAYELLTDATVEGCPLMALGIGLYSQEAGTVPRRLHAILLDQPDLADGTYSTQALADLTGVAGLSVVAAPEAAPFRHLLGVLHADDGRSAFSLFARVDCDTFELLDESPVDFAIRTPPTPGWGEVENVPQPEFRVLTGSLRAELHAVEFYHYDGYKLIIVSASTTDWQLTQRVLEAHADRSDLSIR